MKRVLATILIIVLPLFLCSCGYSEAEMKKIKQEAYDDGFLAATGSPDYSYERGYDDGYADGYDDGVEYADSEWKERFIVEDRSDFAAYVQSQIENVIDSLADYGCYNDEEYVDILNEIYRHADAELHPGQKASSSAKASSGVNASFGTKASLGNSRVKKP